MSGVVSSSQRSSTFSRPLIPLTLKVAILNLLLSFNLVAQQSTLFVVP